MNGFFQAFRMEVLRAIQNSFFPTTYFAILITLFLNIYLYTTTDSYVSVAYLLEYSFIGSLTMLFYVWGVLPHGLSYCVDKRSGFLRQIGNRCPVRNYCIAKCCAAFLTSALTMAMSISTFLWLLSFFRPLDNDVYLDASGYRLWYPSHPLFYFIIAATILSLGSGLFSIVALWISSYIQNSFAIMASPLLLYYTQSMNILLLSPRFHSPIVPVPFLRNLLLLGLLQTPNLLPVATCLFYISGSLWHKALFRHFHHKILLIRIGRRKVNIVPPAYLAEMNNIGQILTGRRRNITVRCC